MGAGTIGTGKAAGPSYTRDLPEERRRQLIEATAACLAEEGLAGTSIRKICARAGVSPGLVGHHFAGKEDLIAHTYEDIGAKLAAFLEEAQAGAGDDPEARLRAFVDASFHPSLLDRDLLAVRMAFWSLVRSDPRIFEIHRRHYAEYRARLAAPIAALAAARGLTLDARLAALSLTAMLDGLWLELCLDPGAFTPIEACRLAHRWIDNLAAGNLGGEEGGRQS